jgi:flagellar biosynthesis/type III secretory pathway M-ring protein FliF/YscJ
MNDLFQSLFGQLKGTSMGTRVIAFFSVLALFAVVGAAAWLSNRPDYELTFSDLNDHEVAKVNKALSEAGIPFDVSQPPAPFSVYVDESERSAAYMAVYGAGALDKPLEGILTDSGVAAVFNSAEERQQSVRKREWAEMELMLEQLDFVADAHVRTSPRPAENAFAAASDPLSASVTLTLAGSTRLSPAQAETVADLVSRGLGVRKENLIVSDQSGNRLYDGQPAEESDEQSVRDLLAHQADFDRRSTDAANDVLSSILGPNKARVAVASEWNYDQSTLRTETPVGKGSLVEESKSTSERPVGDAASRAAGISANVAAVETADEPGAKSAASEASAPLEKTSEEKKSYRPTVSLEERVRVVPSLQRLSVALFLDESIDEQKAGSLQETVKAAVGFVEERDTFQSARLAFFNEPAPAASPPEAVDGGPNPLLGTLLRRGVEIISALAFVFLLLKSLKGAGRKLEPPQGAAPAQPEIDPELLARAQVEELLKSDPKRVGAILSSWVRGETAAGPRA